MHFIVPTRPVHLMVFGLHAVIAHTGIEGVGAMGRKRINAGKFHRQYFEVNYGTLDVPWNVLLGTFHDGTEAAKARMKYRLREHNRKA